MGGWDQGYRSPNEVDAALEAQQRAKLTQFERRLLDVLTDIAESAGTIAAALVNEAAVDAAMARHPAGTKPHPARPGGDHV
jgi:hypothetical protein